MIWLHGPHGGYTYDMTVEQLKLFHEARPYVPFTIHVADGRSIPVPHPEFLARSPSGRTIIVATSDDALEAIDMLLVTRLSKGVRAVRSHRNGKKKP